MEIFSALLALCAGNSGEFPAQRPVTRSFDVFFDLRLNKRLSKQPWGWWFETPSWSLWRQCNVIAQMSNRFNFYTEHGSNIAVLCVNVWNDLTTEMDALGERDFRSRADTLHCKNSGMILELNFFPTLRLNCGYLLLNYSLLNNLQKRGETMPCKSIPYMLPPSSSQKSNRNSMVTC